MNLPCYIDVAQARAVLAEMGVDLSERQIKRAATADIHGRRRLPFFIDPIVFSFPIFRPTRKHRTVTR